MRDKTYYNGKNVTCVTNENGETITDAFIVGETFKDFLANSDTTNRVDETLDSASNAINKHSAHSSATRIKTYYHDKIR